MTNFEYLGKRTKGLGVDAEDIELILLKGGLDGNDPAEMTDCDKALYYNWSIIKKSAVEKVSEGGFEVQRSMEALGAFHRSLGQEIGISHPLMRAFGL